MAMYKQINDDTLFLSQQAIYGSSRLGVLERDEIVSIDSSLHPQMPTIPDPLTENVTHWSRGHKRYELTNHLGNVLATVSDRKIPVYANNSFNYYKAEVMTANDYYAFGMVEPKRSFDTSDYRFAFNGKEIIDEIIGWQDYGMRYYSTLLGRFISPDPLIIYGKKYAELSSFQFASNTPIQAVDLDGLEKYVIKYETFKNSRGQEILHKVDYRAFSLDERANTNPQTYVIEKARSIREMKNEPYSKAQLSGMGIKDFTNDGSPANQAYSVADFYDSQNLSSAKIGFGGSINFEPDMGDNVNEVERAFNNLSPTERNKIDNAVGALVNDSEAKMVVRGYTSPEATDRKGTSTLSKENNIQLGTDRANATKEFLVKYAHDNYNGADIGGRISIEQGSTESTRKAEIQVKK